MTTDALCDCGHLVSYHKPIDGRLGYRCGWCPPHSHQRCACNAPTTFGAARDELYRSDYKVGPQDQIKLRTLSKEEIQNVCLAVLRNEGANVYAAETSEWIALGHQLAFLLLRESRS
jgi:hypothetical protein